MKSKWMKIFMVLMVTMFAASTAFAINLDSRSEEMTAFALCDQAGSITLSFDDADYAIINSHLATNAFVRIRVTLTGTDIDPGSTPPTLCKAISGSVPNVGIGAGGGDLPALPFLQGYVAIDELGVEVSNFTGGADITAYVYGALGSRYFDIYITAIQVVALPDLPWLKVGLHNELMNVGQPGGEESTAICAQVSAFGGLSKLTASYNFVPTSLTINTSDNEIGHFLVDEYTLRDCVKGESCAQGEATSIELCPLAVVPQQALTCNNYYKCAVVEGDFPTGDVIKFTVRSNGATNFSNDQLGVVIRDVILLDGSGTPLSLLAGSEAFYLADGFTVPTGTRCTFDLEPKHWTAEVNSSDIVTNGNAVQYCIIYGVDPDMAVAGTNVQFWLEAVSLPCGNLYNKSTTAAALFDCAAQPQCMYFPYVLSGVSPWATGVVVSNLAPAGVAIADMEVTFILTDSTGTTFTYTKSDFDTSIYSFTLDNVLAEFGWAPAPGNAVLRVLTNFPPDGYSFLTNGSFGGSTLARFCNVN